MTVAVNKSILNICFSRSKLQKMLARMMKDSCLLFDEIQCWAVRDLTNSVKHCCQVLTMNLLQAAAPLHCFVPSQNESWHDMQGRVLGGRQRRVRRGVAPGPLSSLKSNQRYFCHGALTNLSMWSPFSRADSPSNRRCLPASTSTLAPINLGN